MVVVVVMFACQKPRFLEEIAAPSFFAAWKKNNTYALTIAKRAGASQFSQKAGVQRAAALCEKISSLFFRRRRRQKSVHDRIESMRQELLAWFAREGLLLSSASTGGEDLEEDEVKVIVRGPVIALSRAEQDFRECPDPLLFGYPESSLDFMTLQDMHQFVLEWLEKAVAAGMGRCFVCNKVLHIHDEKPWDAVFITYDLVCWLLTHFDCKRHLGRELKGRNPFEINASPPEFFDLRLT